MIVRSARSVRRTVARRPPLAVKFNGVRRVDQTAPRGLFHFTCLPRSALPRMRVHAPPHPESLHYGVCVLSQKNTAFKNNATEIWLFIEMGHKIRFSGEIGIRETNTRPHFCWSLCAADGRWYPASCIWQRKTTTRRVTLI